MSVRTANALVGSQKGCTLTIQKQSLMSPVLITEPVCVGGAGGCAKPEVVVTDWSGASGQRFSKNAAGVEVGSFNAGDLDEKATTCSKECQKNKECFVYEETADGECAATGLFLLAAGRVVLKRAALVRPCSKRCLHVTVLLA